MNDILIVAAAIAISICAVGFIAFMARRREPKDAEFEDDNDDFPETPESILHRLWGRE